MLPSVVTLRDLSRKKKHDLREIIGAAAQWKQLETVETAWDSPVAVTASTIARPVTESAR